MSKFITVVCIVPFPALSLSPSILGYGHLSYYYARHSPPLQSRNRNWSPSNERPACTYSGSTLACRCEAIAKTDEVSNPRFSPTLTLGTCFTVVSLIDWEAEMVVGQAKVSPILKYCWVEPVNLKKLPET